MAAISVDWVAGGWHAAGNERRWWQRLTGPEAYRGWVMRGLLCAGLLLAGLVQADEPQVVNINSADATTLAQVLDGVGLSRAQAIIDYRDRHGDFRDAYELANIKGIGERTVEQNEHRILLAD